MTKHKTVRFGFKITSGPNNGLASGGWRVWTHAEDTYITAKSLGDTWKASLHGDAWWGTQITTENTKKPDTVLPAGVRRDMFRHQPTNFVDRRRLAFVVAVYRHALLPDDRDLGDTVMIEVPDTWDVLNLACVWMTEPNAGPSPNWDLIGGPLPLASGRSVWVSQLRENVPVYGPESQAVGAMIRPVSPDSDDVASPGWIVSGVHLG